MLYEKTFQRSGVVIKSDISPTQFLIFEKNVCEPIIAPVIERRLIQHFIVLCFEINIIHCKWFCSIEHGISNPCVQKIKVMLTCILAGKI